MTYEPIFVDTPASSKDYQNLEPHCLLVSNIFNTLQGEGPFAGERAVFLRLAGCQYGGKGLAGPGCRFCDTDFRLDRAVIWTFSSLIEKIDKEHPGPMSARPSERLLVITGGEPLLQDNLLEFVCMLQHDLPDLSIQVESNGLRHMPLPLDLCLVVSPKVPERYNVPNPKYSHPAPGVLERADCLKILVSADVDSPYHELPYFLDEYLDSSRVIRSARVIYLSPINVYRQRPDGTPSIWDKIVIDQKQSAENHAYAAQLCIEHGYRLSVQQHLFAAIP